MDIFFEFKFYGRYCYKMDVVKIVIVFLGIKYCFILNIWMYFYLRDNFLGFF